MSSDTNNTESNLATCRLISECKHAQVLSQAEVLTFQLFSVESNSLMNRLLHFLAEVTIRARARVYGMHTDAYTRPNAYVAPLTPRRRHSPSVTQSETRCHNVHPAGARGMYGVHLHLMNSDCMTAISVKYVGSLPSSCTQAQVSGQEISYFGVSNKRAGAALGHDEYPNTHYKASKLVS